LSVMVMLSVTVLPLSLRSPGRGRPVMGGGPPGSVGHGL